MIKHVLKVKDNVFRINDSVQISNIYADEKGVTCDIDFDAKMVTEDEAEKIATEFINEALTYQINKHKEGNYELSKENS